MNETDHINETDGMSEIGATTAATSKIGVTIAATSDIGAAIAATNATGVITAATNVIAAPTVERALFIARATFATDGEPIAKLTA